MNSPFQNKCHFTFCLNSNPNDNSRYQNVNTQELKLDLKKQKISLKRRRQLTDRTNKQGDKKMWEQRTRTGTEKPVCNETLYLSNNGIQLRPVNQKVGNMILTNYSTRTFQVPPLTYRNNLPNKAYIVQNPYGTRCLTQRKSLAYISSKPSFQRQVYQTKHQILQKVSQNVSLEKKHIQNQPSFHGIDFQNQYQTVNSVFSNSIIEQRVSQSTIQIDFFNPSATRIINLDQDFPSKKFLKKKESLKI